jgi:phosphoserine phosphatase
MSSHLPHETVLVHFAGHDAPGLTTQLTGILAEFDVNLLDIGQAVVHESLSLGILIDLPPAAQFTALKTALQSRAHDLGLQVRFKTIPRTALQHWLHGLHHSHFIITILGRSITAQQLTRVSAILAAHGMNVDRIDRLSGQLSPSDAPANACVELAVSGDASRELPMRAEFLLAAQQLSIDIGFQRESIFRRNRRLFVFDMDSTLIQGEVIDELARLAGAGDQVSRITEAAMRGDLAFDESFTQRVALLQGLPARRWCRTPHPHPAPSRLQNRHPLRRILILRAPSPAAPRHRLRPLERA